MTSNPKRRLPIALGAAALAVAVLGTASAAVGSSVASFATRAKRADVATNAGAVNGIKASKTPVSSAHTSQQKGNDCNEHCH
jgi:hypothetical protein